MVCLLLMEMNQQRERVRERDIGFIEMFLRRKQLEYKYKGWFQVEGNCYIEIEVKEVKMNVDIIQFVDLEI